MNEEILVTAEHVSKKFSRDLKRAMIYGLTDIARNTLSMRTNSKSLRKAEFWAVDNVSFNVKKGETLGLIGPNGSGKSTILKMLNGIYWPDKGKITMRGRVGALIELGAGFHTMLSGRENIYINAAILGMKKEEVVRKYDSIVEFADIGNFVDTPVKFYSSGMLARLGFAIAVHCEPDVLLVDEVLAVGDTAFQEKCMRRMDDIRGSDKVVIFVTHSLYQIEAMCDRAVWLDHGSVVSQGKAGEVVREYLDTQERKAMSEAKAEGRGFFEGRATAATHAYFESRDRTEAQTSTERSPADTLVEIEGVDLIDCDGKPRTEFPFGSDLTVRIRYFAHKRVSRPLFNLRVLHKGRGVIEAGMLIDGWGPDWIEGHGVVECSFGQLLLIPKVYDVLLFVRSTEGIADIAPMRTYAQFRILDEGSDRVPLRGPMALTHFRSSLVYVPRTWRFYTGNELTCTLESNYDNTG